MHLYDNPQKNRSIRISWLLSYLLITLVPIMMSVLVYFESSRTLEGEINKANSSMLTQASQALESRFEDIIRLNTEIAWNPLIMYLTSNNNLSFSEVQYNYYQSAQVLKNLQTSYNSYNYIDGFYIYDINKSTALLPNTVLSSDYLFDFYHKGGSITYSELLKLLKQSYQNKYIPLDYKLNNGNITKSIAFLNSIPIVSKGTPNANIVTFFDISKLLLPFEKILQLKGSAVLIVDKENNILVSTSPTNISKDVKSDHFLDKNGLIYQKINGSKYALSYVTGSGTGMKYISLTPSKIFWEKAEYVRNLTFLSIFISLLGGSFLSFYFMRRNYNPINNLLKLVKEKAGAVYGAKHNEFEFIGETMLKTISEKLEMNEVIKKQNSTLKSAFLTRLIKGRLDQTIPLEESFHTFGIQFEGESFALVLFYIEDYSGFFSSDAGILPNEEYLLLQFILTNIMEELSNRENIGYVFEIDNMMACLINFKNDSEVQNKQEVLSITSETLRVLSEKFKLHFTASVSSILKSVTMIPQTYHQALEAMEYKLVVGNKKIICYDDIPRDSNNSLKYNYYYPLLVEHQLINTIKAGDYEKSKETLDNIFQSNLENSSISVNTARCLMFDVVSTLVKTMEEIGIFEDRNFLEKINPIQIISNYSTIDEIQRDLASIMMEVCQYANSKRKDSSFQHRDTVNKKLIDNIKKYIEINYSDYNLNISKIGEDFKMSPTYLSKLFKNATNEGLLDYISKYRIEKSKELLLESKVNLSDVCKDTGFCDAATFIRSFKKYEGITPGQFRDMIKSNESNK